MKRLGLVLAVLGLVACGGDDGDGGGSGGGSFTAIQSAIEMPTGTVDMSTAPAIGEEFEKIRSSGAGGERFEQASQQQMMACPSGGSMTTNASGSQSAATVSTVYDACCYQADCCFSGDSTWFFSNVQGAAYSYCGSYSLATTCGAQEGNITYEGCFDGTGAWTYVVRVGDETFSVSGNYSAGNGTLEIRGANGDYTCTYTNGTGSCSGDGSFSF